MNNAKLIAIAEKLRKSISNEDMKSIYENIRLKSELQDKAFYIHGNTGGILYFVVFLLEMAKSANRDHFHFDDSNGMESDSIELILEKYDE